MLKLNVKNETSRLRAVILGTAESNGPTPKLEEAYDPKSALHLREGTYLEAELSARSESNAIEVSRKLLVNNKQVYIVRDSILDLIDVNPVYFSAESAVIKGLENGTLMLSKPTSGAYQGMQVKIFENKK